VSHNKERKKETKERKEKDRLIEKGEKRKRQTNRGGRCFYPLFHIDSAK
jgi:hypothetical protein